MKILVLFLTGFLLLNGCSKQSDDKPTINQEDLIIGTWIDSEFRDSVYVLTRSSELADDKDGFSFNSDGTLVQRANSGWCGTPPISYTNYQGSWTQFPDKRYFIETEFWGGITSFEIEIISIDEETMVYKIWDYSN